MVAADQMTVEAREALLKSKKIYCRWMTPLLSHFMHKYKKLVISFEGLYGDFDLIKNKRAKLYMKIAELVVNEALLNDGVVYALPGSAFIAEDSTYLIYELAEAKGLAVNAILGISFIDVLLSSLPSDYRKYILPELVITRSLSDNISFNRRYAYIIIQTADLYNPEMIKRMLPRYFPADFKFLYIYIENGRKALPENTKIIKFKIKDINRMLDYFQRYDGSIFIPPRQINNEVIFKPLLRNTLRHTKKDGHLIIGKCLMACKRYREAVSELRKAEKEDPRSVQVHRLLGLCYKKLGKIDELWKEIIKALKKMPVA